MSDDDTGRPQRQPRLRRSAGTETTDDDPQAERKAGSMLAVGMGLGVAIGAGLGVVLGNLALGIGLGIAIGAAIGIAMDGQRK